MDYFPRGRRARGFDPDEITTYALRHSSICRSLLKGVPVSVVARLHDTSSDEIEAHYAAYILDVAGDALAQGAVAERGTGRRERGPATGTATVRPSRANLQR